ncbi:MAG: hypothetical protein AB8G05_28185 [Oligoflexales bacterium]
MHFRPIKSLKIILFLSTIKYFPIYGQDNFKTPELFFTGNKIHGSTLLLKPGSFINESGGLCDLKYTVSGLPMATYYSCELCKPNGESCTDSRYGKSIFAHCIIPPGYIPGSLVKIRACVHPEMAWNSGSNCGPKITQLVPVTEACNEENKVKAAAFISKDELAKVSAMSMSSDLFNYTRIKDQCIFNSIEDFDLNDFEQLFFMLGPEFLTESFRFSGAQLTNDQLSKIYKQIDQSTQQEAGLGLTEGEYELPAPKSKPISATLIEQLGTNRYGQLASSLSGTVRSYGAWAITNASRVAADESYKIAADMFWIMGGSEVDQQQLRKSFVYLGQSVEFMANVSLNKGVNRIGNAPGIKDARELVNSGSKLIHAADELAGSLLSTYRESVQTYSQAKKSVTQESMEIAEPMAKQDPQGFRNWINTWSNWMIATSNNINAIKSDVDELNKILHNINNDPKVWENLEKTANNTRLLTSEFTTKSIAEARQLDPRKKAQIAEELKKLKTDLEKNFIELDSIVEGSLKKLDRAVGNNDEEFVKHYKYLYQKYLAPYPDLFGDRYSIPTYQELNTSDIDSQIPKDPRLKQLQNELDELDRIWKSPASDVELVGKFEAKKKSLSKLLSEIIADSPQSGINRNILNSLIVVLEDASIIPKRYSRQVAEAVEASANTSTQAIEHVNKAMGSILTGVNQLNGKLISAKKFFEAFSPKLRILEENLTDPRLYGSLHTNADEIFKSINSIQEYLVLPDELPDDDLKKLQVFEITAVKSGLERLGLLEPLWKEGWGGVFRNIFYSQGHEKLFAALGTEKLQRLDQVTKNLEKLEVEYFAILKEPNESDGKYQELFLIRKNIKENKVALNKELLELNTLERDNKNSLEIARSFDEAMSELNYKLPENLSVQELASRRLDRFIEASKLENAEASIRTFSSYFTISGDLSQKAVKLMDRVLGTSNNLGNAEKSLLKVLGLSFPEEVHETVLTQLYQKKSEIDKLFNPSVYPPRTVLAGEEFGEKFADLLFGKWEDITDPSKRWWKQLGGRLRTKIRTGTGFYLNGKRTHNFLRGQVISYYKWDGFANEVVSIVQEKYETTITKSDVWDHWARVDKDGKIIGIKKNIGGKVGDLIAEKYLSILPGNIQDVAKSHLSTQLRDIVGNSARLKKTTRTGLKIDINNPTGYAYDLIWYKVGKGLLLVDKEKKLEVLRKLNELTIKTRYFGRSLATGNNLTAIILLENLIGSHLENLSNTQQNCEPLNLLSSRYLAHKKRLESFGFIRD